VKARKTKARVREKHKYVPPNQFNMDVMSPWYPSNELQHKDEPK